MKQMQTMKKRQHGLTLISLIIIVMVVAFFAMMAVRLFPVYMEHFSVVSSMKSLGEDPELSGKSPTELLNRLQRRFEINDVSNVTADDVSITRNGDVYTVNVQYDVNTPFLYNIDFTVRFNDTTEVSAR